MTQVRELQPKDIEDAAEEYVSRQFPELARCAREAFIAGAHFVERFRRQEAAKVWNAHWGVPENHTSLAKEET